MSETDFVRTDVHALHEALGEAMASAKEREDQMPSSAAAFHARAENLLRLRNKLLGLMPELERSGKVWE